MKNVTFSVNSYDKDGDRVFKGILLHINDDIILTFYTLDDLYKFADEIFKCGKEIENNYGW